MKIFFIVCSAPEILSSISYIPLVILVSVVPVHLLRFSISTIPLVCVFFNTCISVFKSSTVSFACLIVLSWIFLGFFEGFINFFQLCLLFNFFKGVFHFLFKGIHHFHKVTFKVVFFYFWVRMIKSSFCVST